MCSQCLCHTGPAPAHRTCSLHAHTAQALGCSSRNHPRSALGCLHLPGLSRSGSSTRVVPRGTDSVGPAFCALPRSEQLRCLASAVAATYRLPAARFSGCTIGSPFQADVDRPEPQEVLVSKEACLHLGDNACLGL